MCIPDFFDIEDFEVDEEERKKMKHIDAELERVGFFIGETEWVCKKPFFQKESFTKVILFLIQ